VILGRGMRTFTVGSVAVFLSIICTLTPFCGVVFFPVCEREKIDLWVNVFPEGQGLRFRKLTR